MGIELEPLPWSWRGIKALLIFIWCLSNYDLSPLPLRHVFLLLKIIRGRWMERSDPSKYSLHYYRICKATKISQGMRKRNKNDPLQPFRVKYCLKKNQRVCIHVIWGWWWVTFEPLLDMTCISLNSKKPFWKIKLN